MSLRVRLGQSTESGVMMLRVLRDLAGIGCVLALLAGCSERPVSVNDRSSPAAAVRSLLAAIELRDAAAAQAAFVADTPERQAYVAALGRVLSASGQLTEAARERRWGQDDLKLLVGNSAPGPREQAYIQTETVQGERATVGTAAGERLLLQKVGAEWKIIPGDGGDEAALKQSSQGLVRLADALAAAIEQVRSGKTPSPVEVRQTVVQRGL